MTVSFETLAAIVHLGMELGVVDGEMSNSEAHKILEFLETFNDMDDDTRREICEYAEEMSTDRCRELIMALDDDAKQELSNFLAKVVLADGKLTEEEKTGFFTFKYAFGLPDPEDDSEEDEDEEDEDEEYEDEDEEYEEDDDEDDDDDDDDDDDIIPAFIVVNYDGMTSVQQSENEDWATLGGELSQWIGADGRVEVVRYTSALNALSQQLELIDCHLVFMVARNGYINSVGDNMPASLLYGGGPIYGNIVFALETDKGYEIEGITSRSLLSEVFDAIDDAVDGLLRTE
jgi:hypothetical protein